MSQDNRFIRQEKIIGKDGQDKLKNSCVAIVGVGALGTVASELIVRSGVGKIILIDRDVVEISNLQRQSLFTEFDVGESKVLAAKKKLKAINSSIKIEIHATQLDYENITSIICTEDEKKVDLILDCTDNMQTRFLLNDFARRYKIPWVFSSAVGKKGMLQLITANGPCLSCVMPNKAYGETCANAGVLAASTHLISSLQNKISIDVLAGADLFVYLGYLFQINLDNFEIRKLKLPLNKECKTCHGVFKYLEGEKQSKKEVIQFCSSGIFQLRKRKNIDLKNLYLSVKDELNASLNEVCVKCDLFTAFADGRVLIKAESKEKSLTVYDKFIGN